MIYKQAIIVASASTASAIKFLEGDFDFYGGIDGTQGEGEECKLWWNPLDYYLECRRGLECHDEGGESNSWGYGTGICIEKPVGLGETCDGWNESTGKPFPRCEDGLVCEGHGLDSIPGAGNICQLASQLGLYESCR